MCKKHLIKKHIITISCLLIIWITYGVCGISCPVRYILGIVCPTCGVTRAMIALLRGNFEGYLYYNPMALVLLSDVWVAIHVKFFQVFQEVPSNHVDLSSCNIDTELDNIFCKGVK